MGLVDDLGKICGGKAPDGPSSGRYSLDDPLVLSMIFHPRADCAPPGRDSRGRDLFFHPGGDVTIAARFFESGPSYHTVLFFHGNGEIASDYDEIAPLYTRRGLNLLVVDYRGYGRSTGSPTLENMLQDAVGILESVLGWLHDEGLEGALWVMGRSLGSVPAIHLASSREQWLAGLIVESGFADTLALLSRVGIPVHLLEVPEKWRNFNLEGIAQVRLPTLIIHGERDQIIPVQEGRALLRACGASRKKMVVIPEAGHNDLLWVGMDIYMGALASFVGKAS